MKLLTLSLILILAWCKGAEDIPANNANCVSCARFFSFSDKATFNPDCLAKGGEGCIATDNPNGGVSFNGCQYCESPAFPNIPCATSTCPAVMAVVVVTTHTHTSDHGTFTHSHENADPGHDHIHSHSTPSGTYSHEHEHAEPGHVHEHGMETQFTNKPSSPSWYGGGHPMCKHPGAAPLRAKCAWHDTSHFDELEGQEIWHCDGHWDCHYKHGEEPVGSAGAFGGAGAEQQQHPHLLANDPHRRLQGSGGGGRRYRGYGGYGGGYGRGAYGGVRIHAPRYGGGGHAGYGGGGTGAIPYGGHACPGHWDAGVNGRVWHCE